MPGRGDWPVPITNNGAGMNMAQWVSIYEKWANDMMMAGWNIQDIKKIAEQAGETFPKSLLASTTSKNALFPGANMLYEYDLDNKMKRSFPHKNADYPDGTGYGEWEPMHPDEIAQQQEYYNWKEDPKNYSMIDNQFQGNAYNAWLANSRGHTTALVMGKDGNTVNNGASKPTTGTGASTSVTGPSELETELARNARLDTAAQQFSLERAAREYGEGRPMQNYLSDLYGQVMGVGFERPEYSLDAYANANLKPNPVTTTTNNPGTPITPKTPTPPGPPPKINPLPPKPPIPPNPNPANPIPNSDVVTDKPPVPVRTQPFAPHIVPPKIPQGPEGCSNGQYWFGGGTDRGKFRSPGCYAFSEGMEIPPGFVPGTGGKLDDWGNPIKSSFSSQSTSGGVTSMVEGDSGTKDDTSVHTGDTTPTTTGPDADGCDCAHYIYEQGNKCFDRCAAIQNPDGGPEGVNPPGTPGTTTTTTSGGSSTALATPPIPNANYYKLTAGNYSPNNPTTWGLLGQPAASIAADTDAEKAAIMRSLPKGGERNLAMANAINSGYGKVGGLKQGLVNQALGGIDSISQSKIWGQPMPNSGAGQSLLNNQTAQQGNAQQYDLGLKNYSLGLQGLQQSQKNSSNAMWGTILGSIGAAAATKLLSDAQTKEEVKPFTRGLSDIVELKPVEYRYNGKGGSKKGEKGISVMAQELAKVIPESVVSDESPYKSIVPMGILMAAVNSIKELNTRIIGLEKRKK